MPLRVIKKWGSSPAVRIPAAVMEAASLNLEQEVQVRAENGCVIIEPLAPVVALDRRLTGIAPENRSEPARTRRYPRSGLG